MNPPRLSYRRVARHVAANFQHDLYSWLTLCLCDDNAASISMDLLKANQSVMRRKGALKHVFTNSVTLAPAHWEEIIFCINRACDRGYTGSATIFAANGSLLVTAKHSFPMPEGLIPMILSSTSQQPILRIIAHLHQVAV